jgi:hypothetical protein
MELLERRWNGRFGQIARGDLWLYADGRFLTDLYSRANG